MKLSINDIEKFFEKVALQKATGASVYFLGIGGIGMSAIARYFLSKGLKVSGYDKTETPLTKRLVEEGMNIHYEDSIDLIDKEADVVVYTPAVPKEHQEYNYLLDHGFLILKRSEVLGFITKQSFNICIAGTHGKTTTSSMIAHILTSSGYGCNAFLGGVTGNYETNFLSSSNNVSVVEADEYDRSFLKLSPDIAVITSMDPDHLDIYGSKENFTDAFIEFSSKVKSGGYLLSKKGLERSADLLCANSKTYSIDDQSSNVFVKNLNIENGSYHFDVVLDGNLMEGFTLNMGGMHNVENATVSIAVAKLLKIQDHKIRSAVSSFKGVKRRFEYILKREDLVMIDDYAHHPQELEALLNSAKKLFPQKRCLIIFQPHLYSRTRDFAAGFSKALNIADEIWLLPIYPAREVPIIGVTSEMILKNIPNNKAKCCNKEEVLNLLEAKTDFDVLITAGAGDIDALVSPIKNILAN